MAEYLDLDYCADTLLSEDEAWPAARMVSGVAIGQLIEGAPDEEVCFIMPQAPPQLYEALGQLSFPTGPMEVRFTTLHGVWHPNRAQDDGFYHDPPRQQQVEGDTVTIHAHTSWSEGGTLLHVALPLDAVTTQLMQYGRHSQLESPSHRALSVLRDHEAGKAHEYPRQVQAAAVLAREALYGAAVPVPAYNAQTMRKRAEWCGETASTLLSKIPVFTV